MATIVPFGAQLELLWQSLSQNVVMLNRLWFTKVDAWTTAELIALCEAANDSATDNLLTVMNLATLQVGSRARNVGTDPWGFSVESILATPQAGLVTGDAFPYQVSATVAFLPESGSDVDHGYVRHTGVAESQASGNALTPSAIADIGNAWSNFITDIETELPTADHVVASLFDGFTLVTRPDDTVYKKPTPRVTAEIAGVEAYICRRPLGRAVSRAGLRA